MARWNLANKRQKMISHDQFVDLATQFKNTSQEILGTECAIEIITMSQNKQYTTFWDDHHQKMLARVNEAHTLLKTDKIEDVTAEEWVRSRYVEITVKPVDEKAAANSTFGHAEFRGAAPHMATFYTQGDDKKSDLIKQKMVFANNKMLVGDGNESNGRNSGFVPSFGGGISTLSAELTTVMYERERQRADKANQQYKGNFLERLLNWKVA